MSLQSDLDAVSAWSVAWQLPLNASKCTTLHVGGHNPETNYTLNGAQLAKTSAEKVLGVCIDSDLKFRRQAASAIAEASQGLLLALMRKLFQVIDRETR